MHWTLLFLFLVLLNFLSSCSFTTSPQVPILRGKVFVEDIKREITKGYPISGAIVQALEPESERVIAKTESDREGHYVLYVPPGGPYLIRATKNNLELLDFSPPIRENTIYNLDLTGISSTAITLVLLETAREGYDFQSVNAESIKKIARFDELLERIWEIVVDGGNPVNDGRVLQLVRELAKALFPNPQTTVEASSFLTPIRNVTQNKYYFKLQDAIDEAQSGDTIIASTGIYRENINFKGKNIVLQSTNPDDPQVVAETIIDGGNKGSVVTFQSGESSEAVLWGFTIRNGSGNIPSPNPGLSCGGGIFIKGSSPVLKKNRIQKNSAACGGGIYIEDGSPSFLGNIIEANTSTIYGGGICIVKAFPIIGSSDPNLKNIIQNNQSGLGGGIYADKESTIISDGIPWDRTFYAPPAGWSNPSYTDFNILSTNNHTGGSVGSQVYFEACSVNFTVEGPGEIIASGRVVTNQDLLLPVGATLDLQTIPGTDHSFLKWVVNGIDHSANPFLTFTVFNNTTIQAVLTPTRVIAFKISPNDGTNVGSIFVDGVKVLDGEIETQTIQYYPEGKIINIEAQDLAGNFQNWNTGNNNSSISYEVASDAEVTASFTTPPVKNVTQGVYHREISEATSSAQAKDTLEVSPGIYYENGITVPEEVILKSTGGQDATIIDGNNTSPGIILQSGATIEGFTIQDFSSSAVYVAGENCTIKNNRILNNQADNGGGIYVSSEANNCTITANVIENNQATNYGGGIYASTCSGGDIYQNTIQYNQAGSAGGGIYLSGNISYRDNIIYKNTAPKCPNVSTASGLCE
ncbi:right-handed parallel beta-helix repeat-containing protein [Thermatribacter velox]|uniref:Right-handed parallel beta-helix repeat-containing protein n=1 Tax=Thermatribacter velox TaxID=3039681 RepID=A0ABZ2YEH6_9BACT